MLLANPHLPWSDLFLFYEAQTSAPGVNAYGATLVGFPSLAIAFNDHLGWTHTVNTHDGEDLYELTLADAGYRWDGQVKAFETLTFPSRIAPNLYLRGAGTGPGHEERHRRRQKTRSATEAHCCGEDSA
jgi:acyl-homoserine-lactone acylase